MLTLMQNALAYFSFSGGNIADLLFLFVGVLVVLAIVYFIMGQLGAGPMAYKVLWVVVALIVLLVAIEFFFGGRGSGTGGDVHIGR
jgi:hypothetical protein